MDSIAFSFSLPSESEPPKGEHAPASSTGRGWSCLVLLGDRVSNSGSNIRKLACPQIQAPFSSIRFISNKGEIWSSHLLFF